MKKKAIPEEPYLGKVKIASFNYNAQLYTKFYLWLYGMCIQDYRNRKNKLTLVFEDGTPVTMKVRAALINLIFWKPYIDFKKKITLDTLFDTSTISDKTIYEKLDILVYEFKGKYPLKELLRSLKHIQEPLATIAKYFANKQGNSINMWDIIDLANRNPEFDSILHTSFPDNMPSDLIEAEINQRNERAVNIITSDKDCSIRPFLKAGGNINLGQLAQCIVSIGPRSDIFGNISPVIVNTNFVMGLRNASDYYLESFACRKSLIANKYSMSDSGYTTRQLSLLTMDASLDSSAEDCGTERLLDFYVTDARTLKLMEYKNVLVETGSRSKKQKFREINPKTDGEFIGKHIKVRSHIYCGLGDHRYCKACYGGLSYFNEGIHTNILAAVCLSEPIGQTVLSTKHLMKTRTKVIEWDDKIKTFFKCNPDGLYIQDKFCVGDVSIGVYIEDVDEYLSMLEEETRSKDDDDDDATADSIMLDYVTRFVIMINGERIEFDNLETELYINQEFLSKLMKADRIEDDLMFVSLDGYDKEIPVFDLNVENIEISKFLKRFMSLLGIKTKTQYSTVEDLIQRFVAIITDLGLEINFAHIESIIYNMVRDANVVIKRPDFLNPAAQYVIVPTCSAILNSPSLTTSLSFERIRQQLRTVSTFQKNQDGFLDPFFR